jgi:sulfite exporter TauE/SafE
MFVILTQGLIMGLLGSFHCVGMCGPIALVLPVDRSSSWKALVQTSAYHLGRIVTYALMGLFFGLLGKGLSLAGFQNKISILMGAIMILAVIFPTNYLADFGFGKHLYGLVAKLKSTLGSYLQKKSSSTLFIIGLLNGLLPCGLVYMALTGAVATGDAYTGAAFMALFGVGTSPLLTGLVLAGNFFSLEARNKINKIIPYFVVLVGIIFILRGLELGIKFISPPKEKLEIRQKAHVSPSVSKDKVYLL